MNSEAIRGFLQTLDGVKCNCGITFSREGLTGKGAARDAEHEVLSVYQRHGRVVVVIDHEDLERLATGESLISLLRSRYERVRLSLTGTTE